MSRAATTTGRARAATPVAVPPVDPATGRATAEAPEAHVGATTRGRTVATVRAVVRTSVVVMSVVVSSGLTGVVVVL
ncbi:hypothetical protein, partial [Isoptericola sp. NPDC019482]|uniref:hypothetical protein n=1 Tax=Isoptericola sp. NPDC019482 TaxID=3154688 RepID=UPI00349B9120